MLYDETKINKLMKCLLGGNENYSVLINDCYLSNKKDYPKKMCDDYSKTIENECSN